MSAQGPANKGFVALVGAGPGDPGLITVRGLRCLLRADVIIHDRLIPPPLLAQARPEALLIDVGKGPSGSSGSQDDINRLLYEHASAGKAVCRLKGGDPFLLGRGGEEASYLAERGIPFEIVPGVTSAIAVPAYAGIPVTDRRFASTVVIAAGHEDPTRPDQRTDWGKLASSADTIVVLMAVANLGAITQAMLSGGRSPATPAALIQRGTTFSQRTLTATLADIAQRAHEHDISPPAILVVGDVVRLREQISWFERLPLFGRRVLVPRPAGQTHEIERLLSDQGAEPVCIPAIEIRAIEADPNAIIPLMREPWDWIIFTSPNAVRHFLTQLRSAALDIRALGAARLAAVGPGTAEILESLGLTVSFAPAEFTSEQLAASLPDLVAGARVLLPRAAGAPDALPRIINQRGANVTEWPVYETLRAAFNVPAVIQALDEGAIHAIALTSSSVVRALVAAFAIETLAKADLLCIGPATAATLRDLGLEPTLIADPHTPAGLVTSYVELMKRRTGDTHETA